MSVYPNTPDNITSLRANEVFVFGSNTAGWHGKGAALTAMRWGAIYGQGEGPAGQTYAIPTKCVRMGQGFLQRQLGVLPLWKIKTHIRTFLRHAAQHPDKRYLVTEIGCGLAGYKPKDIAPLFHMHTIPANVSLPASFWRVRYQHEGPRGPHRVIVPEDEIGENSRGEV